MGADAGMIERKFSGVGTSVADSLEDSAMSRVEGHPGSADALLKFCLAVRSLRLGLEEWAQADGSMECRFPPPPRGVRALMIGTWHISLRQLRWDVLLFLPAILTDTVLRLGPSATDFAGLLRALEHAITRLDESQRTLLLRLSEQARVFDGTTFDELAIGLSRSDKEVLAEAVRSLVASGVVEQSDTGRLKVIV